MISLSHIETEQRNPATMHLDEFSCLEIAQAMIHEDQVAVSAVREVLPDVATAMSWASDAIRSGGRIIYVGAGTSGRLGVLDASECPPTFGVTRDQVVGIIAGGREALYNAVEGIEDKPQEGAEDLASVGPASNDIVFGLAASGRTPYVLGAVAHARSVGCRTVAITCNPGSELGKATDLAIEPRTGPEVLTGSTRLKAGTAQKLILNMISTGAMTKSGKVYQNLMVNVRASNQKLQSRAMRIVMSACRCSAHVAHEALDEAGGDAKVAITSVLLGVSTERARRALDGTDGSISEACAQSDRHEPGPTSPEEAQDGNRDE